MIEKNGMLTEESVSDFDTTKKAEYYDAIGFGVADKGNKDKLGKPVRITSILDPWTEQPVKVFPEFPPTRTYTDEEIKKRFPLG